jgi:two-component system, NtrC family, sensor kinase
MKIVHKIVAANVLNILLIALTGFFAYRNLDEVLTKLRFVEFADSLNSSFLEMRLSEKNYFLYGDKSTLTEIGKQVNTEAQAIEEARPEIVRAIGEEKLQQLESNLLDYRGAIEKAETEDGAVLVAVREAGQKLRDLSKYMTDFERAVVNRLLASSRGGLFSSLALILVSAVGITHLISVKVLRSLKQVERAAHLIPEGGLSQIEAETSRDECGMVIAALRSMAEELQNREEQILEARKLASIGILTAGVAHEVGNPLNNISMMAQTYVEVYDNLSKEERIDYMKRIEEETERIQRIVKDLLDFSRPKKPDLKECSINGVVQKSMRLVQNMIHLSNIDAHLSLEDDPASVLIDEHQIQEVLVNLLTNALHASAPGDSLSLRTRFNPLTGRVEVEVEDSGKGIAPEMLAHIFDPFFTTKGATGTGLGLFVSYGIVKNHKGDIKVRSEPGVGTCFTLELPPFDPAKRSEECLVTGL